MDAPSHGGPDFEAIVNLLDSRNCFNGTEGFCDLHQLTSECKCKKLRRHGLACTKFDPRLNQEENFHGLSYCEQAKRLLNFQRWCVSNFLVEYYGGGLLCRDKCVDADLSQKDVSQYIPVLHRGEFFVQLRKYNQPMFNFLCHLVCINLAKMDLDKSCDHNIYNKTPGTWSPFRDRFLWGVHSNTWNDDHRGKFRDGVLGCLGAPEPSLNVGQKRIQVLSRRNTYTPSQIQRLPETIRGHVMNCVDDEAVAILGKTIADTIDLHRPVRETYEAKKEMLGQINWMPCLGAPERRV